MMKKKKTPHETRTKERKTRLFGTDGIRGRANTDPISTGTVLKLGQAIGHYFKRHYEKPRILIGKDTRKSGYMLEQALSSGICSVGVDTFFLGPPSDPWDCLSDQGNEGKCGNCNFSITQPLL